MAAIGFKITGELPRLGRADGATLLRSAAAGAALSLFGSGFLALEAALVPAFGEQIAQHERLMQQIVRPESRAFIPIVIGVVAILPAIFEEILFRGVLRQYLARSMGRSGRVVTLGVLFGLLHVSPVLLLPLIYAGMLWTLLAERTGGWAAPAVSHFAMNATSAVVLVRVGALETPGLLLSAGLVCAGSVVATAVIAGVVDEGD